MVENEELGVISALLDLRKSSNPKIKAAVNGTLWNLRKELEKSEKFHDLGKILKTLQYS